MSSLEEREQNLFNATSTLAQFYDEIESFMDLLFGSMERKGFSAKAERLRSGTFTTANLPRRLLASANVIYIRDAGDREDDVDDFEVEEEADEEAGDTARMGKEELAITPELRIPFVHLYLFPPKAIPSMQILEPPKLILGALGNMRFVDRKTGLPATPDSPSLALSNLAQVPISPDTRLGKPIRIDCWRPKVMRRYKMEAKIIAIETARLLEMD